MMRMTLPRLLFGLMFLFTGTVTAQTVDWQFVGRATTDSIAIMVFDSSGGIIIATDTSGLFRSSDGGTSWYPCNTGLADSSAQSLVVSSTGTIFFATKGGRIYRSTDEGATWQQSANFNPRFNSLATAEGHVYGGGCYTGLWKTTDDGLTWNRMDQPGWFTGSLCFLHMYMTLSGDLYMSSPQTYYSTDQGFSWILVDGSVSTDFTESPYRYTFGTEPYYWPYPIWRNPYIEVPTGLPQATLTDIESDIYGRLFVAHPDSGIFHSIDHGQTWNSFGGGIEEERICRLLRSPNNYLIGGSADGKIFRTVNQTLTVLTPILRYPESETRNVHLSLRLGWQGITGATSYHVQVSSDNFVTLAVDATTVDTSLIVTVTDSITAYRWRVQSISPTDTSGFTAPWRFITGPPPSPPELLSPLNGSAGIPVFPLFKWRSVPRATWYWLEVSTDSLFSLVSRRSTPDTSDATIGLRNDTKFFWRVRAYRNSGEGTFSEPFNFTTVEAPPQYGPPLLSPSENEMDVSFSPAFRWQRLPIARLYHIQVSLSGDFSGPSLVVNDSLLTDTVFVPSVPLREYTFYYWRVKATNDGGSSYFSIPKHFTTKINPPLPPVLISPADNDTGVSPNNLLFRWRSIKYTTDYHFEIGGDTSFSGPNLLHRFVMPDSQVILNYVAGGQRLYWRVAAENRGGKGEFTSPRSFVTRSELPVFPPTYDYYISELFPNPFNGVSSILVSSPVSSYVKIEVFNSVGMLVTTLEDRTLPSGRYQYEWAANNTPTGVYFVRVQLGDLRAVRAALYLK